MEDQVKKISQPPKTDKKTGSFRKREKFLLKKIRNQMEFYLGDANLSKDRFLKQEINKSKLGWLNIELFTRFNLMKKITTDEGLIVKALAKSKIIEISEDNKSLKRRFPVKELKNTEDRTIYVENLPKSADHEWVRTQFSECGEIVYVSVPKFQTSGDIKGFAFVEFKTTESAERAKRQYTDGNDVPVNVGVFPLLGNKDVIRMRGQVNSYQDSPEFGKIITSQLVDLNGKVGNRKRARSASESESVCSHKKSKVDQLTCDQNFESSDLNLSKEQGITIKQKCSDNHKEDKKKKIRNKKNKGKREKMEEGLELRVLLKKDWLELRGKYIATQKKNMQTLKETLRHYKQTDNTNSHYTKKTAQSHSEVVQQEKGQRLAFQPNVIVRVQSQIPLKRDELRTRIEEFGEVAYIDILNGDTEGHIRCLSDDTASRLADAHISNHAFSLVTGPDEVKYWEKLFADQEKKLSSKVKTKRRGKNKIEDKAQIAKEQLLKTHVYFDGQ